MSWQEFSPKLFDHLPDLIGLFGVCCILAAYMLLQLHYWSSRDLFFSCINLLGSICILFSLFFSWNLSSVVIEIAWMSISLYGILNTTCRSFLFSVKKKEAGSSLANHSLADDRETFFHPLDSSEKGSILEDLPNGWEVVDGRYLKTKMTFDHYQDLIDFTNQIANIAEKENHHPDLFLEYKTLTITISTHNINALTKADYILAAKISNLSLFRS